MRAAAFLILLTVNAPNAAAAEDCPAEPRAAILYAKAALISSDRSRDDTALLCLIEAVAALDAKLNDLIAGKVPFSGDLVTSGQVKGTAFIHRAVDDPAAKGDR